MNRALLILAFFLISCGYQPIYINKNIKDFEYSKIVLKGNDDINKKIINSVPIKEGNANESKFYIFSSYQAEPTSKNTKSQVTSFRTTLIVDLEIRDLNDKVALSKNFIKEISYNNKQNKFDLVEYQNSIKNNLTDKIVSEIIIYLNSNDN